MKYGCSRINLPFGYNASRIYRTLDSLKEKLFKESKTCLEPEAAIYEWWADNYDSVSQFLIYPVKQNSNQLMKQDLA